MSKHYGVRWEPAVAMRLAVVAVIALLGLISVAPVGAQSSSVVWQQFDVHHEVRSDGSVHVVEDQIIQFNGSFSYGFADIPFDNVEEIGNLSVTIDGEPARFVEPSAYREEPGTFTYRATSSMVNLDYGFAQTSYGDERHIVLEYDLFGALRVYEDLEPANQQLWRVPITREVTDVAPIESSTVSITLPEEVAEGDFVASPVSPEIDGRTFSWTRTNLDQGDSFEVRLQFPPITSATVPSWQQLDDQQRQEQEQQEEREAVAGTALLGVGLLILVVGGLGFSIAWFTKGRDPHVGMVADYIANPPDDLSPGAAGALVDETVQTRDVLATVLDLARRGAIVIHESGKDEGVFGLGGGFTHEFELKDPAIAEREFERKLLDVMFGVSAEPGKRVSMTEFRQSYTASAASIGEGFYDELVSHGYFHESPETTRKRWGGIAVAAPVITAIVAFIIVQMADVSTGWIWFVVVAAIIVAIYASKLSRHMAVKTREGAEAAAKWSAFKRYLEDIDERENLEESKEIFERYLPYAVAFGLERSFVQKFAAAEVPMPGWFDGGAFGMPGAPHRPMRRGRRTVVIGNPWLGGYPGQGYPGQQAGGGDSGGFGGFPDLQDMSDTGGRTLQGGSDSFFDMLDTAARAFTSSSGRSGGGSFGSFGGGGGFSGGGSFGGGGGGGGRGFG
ncbi:MAG TPA: DUF2207 domain-containing protein [Thermomicrobiales bacterium]|nr:DUF2207 domain-containing protein [Thermomicrobiales bacterium]